jgi:hypothetical protein
MTSVLLRTCPLIWTSLTSECLVRRFTKDSGEAELILVGTRKLSLGCGWTDKLEQGADQWQRVLARDLNTGLDMG